MSNSEKQCEEIFKGIKNPSMLNAHDKKMYLAIHMAKSCNVELRIAYQVFIGEDEKTINEQFDLAWNNYQLPEHLRYYVAKHV